MLFAVKRKNHATFDEENKRSGQFVILDHYKIFKDFLNDRFENELPEGLCTLE